MFTLEQKVDLILRYIASSDNAQRSQLKKQVVKALTGDDPDAPTPPTVDDIIYDLFKTIGVPQHLKGYEYATRAIKLCILDPSYISRISYGLYPDIAHLYGVHWKSVEICIRRAIEITFKNGNLENVARVFGNTVNIDTGKLTSREFITACYNEVTRRMKKYGIEV